MAPASKYNLSIYSPDTKIKNILYSPHLNPLISNTQGLSLIYIKNVNMALVNSGSQTLPEKAKYNNVNERKIRLSVDN